MTSGRAALAIASALGAAACAPARPPPSPPSSHAPPAPDRDAYALVEAPYEPGPLPAVPPLPPRRTGHDIEVVQPDAEARTTARVIDGPTLGHDPQVAVGERFVVVYDAHFYAVLDKATGRLVDARPGDESAPRGDFGTLFSPVWAPRDRLGRPNPHDVNLKLDLDHEDARVCDPEHPTESVACVQEFYDTRIVYDAARKRFWIESAARNHLWRCGPKTACPDARHSPTHARRFIAVAVSRTDDPRDGFHRYVLVDEYADWPKIGVHGRYLVLSHRMSPNLYVFDADVLAAGNPSRGPVRLAKLDVRDYGVRYFAPVAHRGPPSDVTLVLGGTGSERVRPIALVDAGAGAAPRVVAGDWVEASRRVPPLDNPAVFRADLVTATWDECAGGEHAPCDGLKQVHVLRFPARYEAASGRLVASVDRARGFLDVGFGGREPDDAPSDEIDYEKPALDVDADLDTVVVYARRGVHTRAPVLPEVRYSVLYRGEPRPRAGVLVRRGTFGDLPDIDDNAKAGIDLADAQVDATDERTVWVTHAYGDVASRWFRQVTAAVRPRP